MSAIGSDNAEVVLRRRYLLPGERPTDAFARVARVIAAIDAQYGASEAEVARTTRRFHQRMVALDFLPNSPTLGNAGRNDGQLAACFVLPVEDSIDGVFAAMRAAALVHKSGGGTGFAFSRLRPSGDTVAGQPNVAAGPVELMQAFSAATSALRQGGTRSGANMGVLRIDHPDILDFIGLKLDPSRLRNFNVSVGVTDAFMDALAADADYGLVNPRTGVVVRTLSAARVFKMIADVAWECGDPGLLFLDRIEAANPTPHLGAIEATNPCGEQPLLPNESCVLGSVNLARMVESGTIAWDRLREVVADGVHFLDNVIDASTYPLPAIAELTRTNRKIGLGVMGLADLLIELGVPYDSEEAIAIGERIAAFVEVAAVDASESLAATRGVFPAWAESTWRDRRRVRNATVTTVAPTGTLSIIAGCSSGIEPLFAIAYERRVLDGEVLVELHPRFRERAERGGYWSERLAEQVSAVGGVRHLPEVPAEEREVFATAHDIDPEYHLRMQAVFQRSSHSGVSKTVNLPETATPADVLRVYRRAYALRCKGVTVYRDGSRSAQVLAFGGRAAAGVAPPTCVDCGGELRQSGRCTVCLACGLSRCGL